MKTIKLNKITLALGVSLLFFAVSSVAQNANEDSAANSEGPVIFCGTKAVGARSDNFKSIIDAELKISSAFETAGNEAIRKFQKKYVWINGTTTMKPLEPISTPKTTSSGFTYTHITTCMTFTGYSIKK